MASTDPTKKPNKPLDPSELPDLPELEESTDFLELNVDLDPGGAEPIGQLELDDVDLLQDLDDFVALDRSEPDGTALPSPLEQAPLHLIEDDLEDFSTQEELPILPWRLEAHLLELGEHVPAVLDPTRARSVWEKPGASPEIVQTTVRLRMLDIPAEIEVVAGDAPLLRLGRDIIGGRLLIATD
ncbi:MAG: hypothetical protein H6737_15965 [Alphaproteobacteria bacterium]|nr:hypothetical protein [Alphaproteobacteria bacterium]